MILKPAKTAAELEAEATRLENEAVLNRIDASRDVGSSLYPHRIRCAEASELRATVIRCTLLTLS